MPVWGFILLGVGGIVATIATTPLWMYVLNRPKVRFARGPAAFWSYSETEEGEPSRMYVGVDMALQNDGNEESHITDIRLDLEPFAVQTRFNPSLLSRLENDGRIDRNGGQLAQRLAFAMGDPGSYKLKPQHREEVRYFNTLFNADGTLRLRPSQNKRIFWGHETISADIDAEWMDWPEMRDWLSDAGVSLP